VVKVLNSDFVLNRIVEKDFKYWSGVPCSLLGDFITYTSESRDLEYVSASNEGEAVAINAGLFLGNKRGISIFQNSGLGNAINPLSSLIAINRIQAPLIMSMRGNHFGFIDEPQHEVMGRMSESLLTDIGYSCNTLNGSDSDTEAFEDFLHMLENGTLMPAMLVHRNSLKTSLQSVKIKEVTKPSDSKFVALESNQKSEQSNYDPELKRSDVLEIICQNLQESDVVIATTGYTSRELAAIADRQRNFYMVGAMGCASAVALGVALARPHNRVIVLDGDGAALMRLGTFSTIGNLNPENLIHVLLANNQHESTGGQSLSSSSNFSFEIFAKIAGYPSVQTLISKTEINSYFSALPKNKLQFVRIPIQSGTLNNLPRPKLQPFEITDRLKSSLRDE
jgi:phosphonopyruvate decarboxylase